MGERWTQQVVESIFQVFVIGVVVVSLCHYLYPSVVLPALRIYTVEKCFDVLLMSLQVQLPPQRDASQGATLPTLLSPSCAFMLVYSTTYPCIGVVVLYFVGS